MTKTFRKLLFGGGAFILGALLGPLLVAALASLNNTSDSFSHDRAAFHLLSAFDDRYPDLPTYHFEFELIALECGYDEKFFGDDLTVARGQNWTSWTGYLDLHAWVFSEFEQEVKKRRAEQVGARLNDFGLAFLGRCLTQTVFAPLCARKVQQVLEDGGVSSNASLRADGAPFEQRRRRQTICTYLDGVAAQKGMRLAQRVR